MKSQFAAVATLVAAFAAAPMIASAADAPTTPPGATAPADGKAAHKAKHMKHSKKKGDAAAAAGTPK